MKSRNPSPSTSDTANKIDDDYDRVLFTPRIELTVREYNDVQNWLSENSHDVQTVLRQMLLDALYK